MLSYCKSLFSLEVHDEITESKSEALCDCSSLRNVAIPPNAALADDVFVNEDERLDQELEGKCVEFHGQEALLYGS